MKSPEKQQSVILAAYSYPFVDSDYWKTVIREGGEKIPYVVINPNNGPGNKVDLNYVRQLEENVKAGTLINYPLDLPSNKLVLLSMASYKSNPATAVIMLPEEERLEGIGYWVIQTDFKVS